MEKREYSTVTRNLSFCIELTSVLTCGWSWRVDPEGKAEIV